MPDTADTIPPEAPSAATLDDVAALLQRLVELAEAPAQAEGLTAAQAADYLNLSLSKFRQLHDSGMVPMPAMLGDGRCPRWSRHELACWLKAGAPSRLKWQSMKDSVLRRAG